MVPRLGKFPDLGQRERFPARHAALFTPAIDALLRPEEQDRRSGMDQVVVPGGEGQREVDQLVVMAQLAAGDHNLYLGTIVA